MYFFLHLLGVLATRTEGFVLTQRHHSPSIFTCLLQAVASFCGHGRKFCLPRMTVPTVIHELQVIFDRGAEM